MKLNHPSLTLLITLVLSPLATQTHAAEPASSAILEVRLIEASNLGTGIDKSLAPYADTLKRLFKFDSYRQLSRSQLKPSLPGSAESSLGNGTRLRIGADAANDKTLTADLNWTQGQRTLVHTRLQLSPGQPAVLGGPRSKDGSYLILVTWKN